MARVVPVLDALAETVTGDLRRGVQLVQSVLTLPLARIAFNSGADPNDVVGRVCALSGNHGYNAATGVYEDLIKSGVVDPTKVTRVALQNAASIAGLLLTTECMITDVSEETGAGSSPVGES